VASECRRRLLCSCGTRMYSRPYTNTCALTPLRTLYTPHTTYTSWQTHGREQGGNPPTCAIRHSQHFVFSSSLRFLFLPPPYTDSTTAVWGSTKRYTQRGLPALTEQGHGCGCIRERPTGSLPSRSGTRRIACSLRVGFPGV
jgi:hypothetical protein